MADPESQSALPTNVTESVITPEEWQERVQTTILFVAFGSWGTLMNALPILLTVFTDLRKTQVNHMVAHLSTADLLYSALMVFVQPMYILYREQMDPVGCKALGFFAYVTAFFEYIFPPVLSVNRYISLYHNNRYDGIYTVRNINLMVLSSWTFCAIIPMIFTLGGQTGFDDDNQHCCIVVKNSHIFWIIFYWLAIIVPAMICDGTVAFCNYKLYMKFSDHESLQTLTNNVIRQNKEMFYFLIADMTFPFLVHSVYQLGKFLLSNRTYIYQKRFFNCLYLFNAGLRGVFALTMLRPYRRTMRGLLNCTRLMKNAVTPNPVS